MRERRESDRQTVKEIEREGREREHRRDRKSEQTHKQKKGGGRQVK